MSSSHYAWNGHWNHFSFKPGKCCEARVWPYMPNSVHISWHLSFVLELPLFLKGLTMCNFNCEPCFCRTFWQFGSEFLFLANLSIRSRLFKHRHSKRKMFLSICSLDKHCIKFGCPKPKSSSCPKSLVRNSKTIRHLMFLITLFPL